jgi:hypothetical protein
MLSPQPGRMNVSKTTRRLCAEVRLGHGGVCDCACVALRPSANTQADKISIRSGWRIAISLRLRSVLTPTFESSDFSVCHIGALRQYVELRNAGLFHLDRESEEVQYMLRMTNVTRSARRNKKPIGLPPPIGFRCDERHAVRGQARRRLIATRPRLRLIAESAPMMSTGHQDSLWASILVKRRAVGAAPLLNTKGE